MVQKQDIRIKTLHLSKFLRSQKMKTLNAHVTSNKFNGRKVVKVFINKF